MRNVLIHVNHLLDRNKRTGDREPVIAVHKNAEKQAWCNEVEILDRKGRVVATIQYEPDHPLKTGATVFIKAERVRISR